jgi:hypothetical protein
VSISERAHTRMNATSSAVPVRASHPFRAILWAGFIAGALDITAAILFYGRLGRRTVPLLQGIAAGLLGKAAFEGGLATAALGLLCHFFIATSWAATYYAASRRLAFLVEHPIASGAVYAVGIYLFMDRVVVPLSAIGPRPFSVNGAMIGAGILVVCVGIPIALTVRHFLQRRTAVGDAR